jgi:hypothetical protein
METNELFTKIVQLEDTSQYLIQKSILDSETIKNQTKKERENLVEVLNQEKKQLISQLEIARKEEEDLLKNKYAKDYEDFTSLLNSKFEKNLQEVIAIFKEKNKI